MYFHYFLLLFLVVACTSSNPKPPTTESQSEEYVWSKVLDTAPFPKSYNYQMFVKNDSLYALHSEGAWVSADGKQWILSTLSNCIGNQAFLDYIEFQGVLYGLGYLEGNIENYTFKPLVFRSKDFRSWDTLRTNLPERFFYHPFVFQNKIWFIGGEDKNRQYSDIWNSEDGIRWVKQKENLAFGNRSNSQVVFFRDKLFLLTNDVWSSSDGLHWEKETDEILKGQELFGYKALVFEDRIWLLGCNRNGKFDSKVFSSLDGKNWQSYEAPWTPRGAVAASVFKGKIWLTGGKYGGLTQDGSTTEFVYSNDVWAFGKVEKNK